jgi:ribosomal-protein-alanine acetyltransferase
MRKLRGIPLEAGRTKRQIDARRFPCGPRRTGAAPFQNMPREGRPSSAARSDLKVRKARPSDADQLARLEDSVFSTDRLSRRRFVALTRRPSACILVACRGREIVGYALLLMRRGISSARLYSIAVAPEETGRGVGARLLAEIEAAARERHTRRLHLEVRADNPKAIRFYEGAGYALVGRRPDYYADGMAALLYSRDLPPQARHRALPLRRAA